MITLLLLAQIAGPTVGAESGVYSEAYSISGRTARRPGETVRLYASPTFSWMGFEVGTTLMWSTESDLSAQSTNRYYLNPRWGWGQLHLGDYTPALSRYTAQAVRVRGGGFEIAPGRFRLQAMAGRAQEATDLTTFDAAPRRIMYGGLAGWGDPARTFVELSALRAVDDSSGADTISATPQENLVAAAAFGVTLGRIRLRADYSASLFSRDIRASELDSTSQPATEVFTPRLSSRFDRAWSAEARIALGRGSIAAQVEHVGPGFTSLGNPYLSNDREEARLNGVYRMMGGRLTGAGSFGVRRDNLAGDKRGTTWRRTGSLTATLISGRHLVSSVSMLVNGLSLSPAPLAPGAPDPGLIDSFRIRNVTLAFTLLEQLRLGAHTVSLTLASQRVNDDSPRFGTSLDAASTTANLDWSVQVGRQLQFSLRPGYQRFTAAGTSDDHASMGASLSRRMPRSPWSASLAGTWTKIQDGNQWRSDAMFGYRITARDQLSASVRYTKLSGVAEPFNETLASLRVTHRW